jgi:hypothetical protein
MRVKRKSGATKRASHADGQDENPRAIAQFAEKRCRTKGELREEDRLDGPSVKSHSEQLHDSCQECDGVQFQAH